MAFNQPLGGNQMPRFGGPTTMMRLPAQDSAGGLDACFVGVPLDIGTSNRSGARFGPRQIRAESFLMDHVQIAGRFVPGIDPFAYLRDVLLRITTAPAANLHGLFPDRWKATLES